MSLIMLLRHLSLHASFVVVVVFFNFLSLVQFVLNLPDKRLKVLIPEEGGGGYSKK